MWKFIKGLFFEVGIKSHFLLESVKILSHAKREMEIGAINGALKLSSV